MKEGTPTAPGGLCVCHSATPLGVGPGGRDTWMGQGITGLLQDVRRCLNYLGPLKQHHPTVLKAGQ